MKVKREEALNIILNNVHSCGWEYVKLDNAYGRVLAEDVVSPVDVPDVNKSAVDGYGFRVSSLKKLPAKLKVVGEVQAGDVGKFEVKEGEAVFVMTGGAVPDGVDVVVRVEDVKREGDEVVVDFPVERGELVNFVGSEIKKGEVVLTSGERLDYRKVGLLANIGVYKVRVFRKPVIGVATTGNEVLEAYEPHRTSCVRNVNYYVLQGLLSKVGAVPINLGNLEDDLDLTIGKLEETFNHIDVLVTTGGVSKGKYDFIKRAIELLGFDVKFTSTNIRPGRPLVFAVKGEKVFFGLPGYPSATLVNAVEFLLPAVRKMAGEKHCENVYYDFEAGERIRGKKGRVDFVRINIRGSKVYSAGNQQTANFYTIANCDGLAVIDEDRGYVEEGEIINVLLFCNRSGL